MRGPTADQIADHQRDYRKHEPRPEDRVRSVAYLTAYLDTMLAMGTIPEPHVAGLRQAVTNTRNTFDLPPLLHHDKVSA